MIGLTAAAIGVAAACLRVLATAFVRWRADRITKELIQQVLRGCPHAERADILSASAELAGNLGPRSSPWHLNTNRGGHWEGT
jgi:hypothetical protein